MNGLTNRFSTERTKLATTAVQILFTNIIFGKITCQRDKRQRTQQQYVEDKTLKVTPFVIVDFLCLFSFIRLFSVVVLIIVVSHVHNDVDYSFLKAQAKPTECIK